jgi:HEAT repeat protein
MGADLALTAAVNGYGRDLEDDADRIGLRYAYEAGYDPFPAVELWRVLSKRVPDEGAVSNWFFGDHSTQRARISNLTLEINLRYRGRVEAAGLARNEKEYRLALMRHAAMALYARSDYAGAERALRRLLEAHPGDAAAHLYLGSVYRALEPTLRSERAVAEYERAGQLDPSLAAADRELGSYFFMLGDHARAASHLEAYLKKAPDAPDAADVRERLLSSRSLSPQTGPGLGAGLEPSLAQAVATFRQPNARARQEAVQVIRRAGTAAASAVPALIAALDEVDPAASADVVSALAFLGPTATPAVPKLVGLVQGSDRSLRLAAIHALGNVGTAASPAVPALTAALEDPALRSQAVVALGKMGPAARPAAPALVGLLRAPSSSDRVSAAIALGTIGADSATVPAVALALGMALKDESTTLRQQAAQALGQLGPSARAAVPHLVEALQGDNPFVCGYAAHALGEMGKAAQAALPALREKLKDEDPDTRKAAAEAVRKIEGT